MPVVTVQPSGEQVLIGEGETVLEGLFRAGYAYTAGCRRGGCGICKADLRRGSVSYRKMIADTVLTDAERADGTCLTCRAVPDGDVTIALRAGPLRRANPFLVHRAAPPHDTPLRQELTLKGSLPCHYPVSCA